MIAGDDTVRWVLQDNLGSRADLAALQAALDRYSVAWTAVSCVPFDDTPPDVPTDGRVLFYGATTLVTNVARARRWSPGVYFDEDRFAFEALRADFTAIANPPRPDDRLYISAAFHKVFVEVNEAGTEAAAATAVAMGRGGGMPTPAQVTFAADHPFLFVIRDRANGAVLFMGRTVDPRAAR